MRLLIVSLSVVIVISGCIQPEVTEMNAYWGNITESYSELKAEVMLDNPLPFLPLKDIESTVYINGIEIAQGHAEKIETNKAILNMKIDNERIRDLWVSHMKSNETSEMVIKVRTITDIFVTDIESSEKFTETLKTDIFRMNIDDIEFKAAGKEIFAIEDIELNRGEVSNLVTEVVMSSKLVNSGILDVEITGIDYEITINDVLAGKGSNNLDITVRTGETKDFEIVLFLDNKKIPEWWIKHLKNGERSKILLKAKIYVRTGILEGAVIIEQEKTFTTNIAGSLTRI